MPQCVSLVYSFTRSCLLQLLLSPAYFQSVLKPAFEHSALLGNQEMLNTNFLFEVSYIMKKSNHPRGQSGFGETYKMNLSPTSSPCYTKAQWNQPHRFSNLWFVPDSCTIRALVLWALGRRGLRTVLLVGAPVCTCKTGTHLRLEILFLRQSK